MLQKLEPRTVDLKLTKIGQVDTGLGNCVCYKVGLVVMLFQPW